MANLVEILRDYSDGNMMVTSHIQNAIDECNLEGGGDVHIPPGKYLTGPLFLKSNVNIVNIVYIEILSGIWQKGFYLMQNR